MNNAPSKDGQWFDYYIKVEGKHVIIKIDGKTTVDWTEPDNWAAGRPQDRPAARSPSRATTPRASSTSRTSRSGRWTRSRSSSSRAGTISTTIRSSRCSRATPDIQFVEAAQKDHSELFENIGNWDYDVIVLYNMTQTISEKRQKNFKALLEKGVGLVALHHAEGAFNTWEDYRKIIGVRYPLKPQDIDGMHFATATYRA